MAGEPDLLTSLAALLRTLDDDAYASLANRGLLRRARKDLENGLLVEVGAAAEGWLSVKVGECLVRFPAAGPSQATCSCPAPGCCQHILAACLRLAELTPVPAAAPDQPAPVAVADELPDVDSVKKWAGAENFRRALRLVSGGEVAGLEGRLVRFAGEIDARLLPGGLDAAITNAPVRQRFAYVAAATLALLQQAGVALPFESQERGVIDLGALEDLQALIEEGIEVGLNHLSHSYHMRLSRLSIQCRVAGLIRPSLEAEGCAQEIEWLLARHGQADHVRLLDKLTRLYALAESIRRQGSGAAEAYIGTARSKYVETGVLDLVGAGCYPWETESGFIGITALFWSRSSQEYFSWSDSRPKHSSAGFEPGKTYAEGAPWPGGGLLRRLLVNRFSLENTRSNAQRRISAHAGARVTDALPASLEDLPPAVTQWSALRERKPLRGLLRGSPLDELVHVRPKEWGAPFFDEIEQRLLLPLEDASGETLLLQLPFSRLTAAGVFYLEGLNPVRGCDSLIAYHRRSPGEHLFPIRLVRSNPAFESIDLLFQSLPTKKVTFRGAVLERLRAFVPLPQADDDAPVGLELNDPLTALLSPIDDLLTAAAEGNLCGRLDEARKAAEVLQKAGLGAFAGLFRSIETPRDVLTARYVYSLLIER